MAVGGTVGVGDAGPEDAQAVSKATPVSKLIRIILVFIFTSIDNYIACHIIIENRKGWDEDEYASNDGTESRQSAESLPETSA